MGCLKMYFQQKAATLFNSVDEATCDAATPLQDDVALCQLTAQERLERLAGQGGGQSGSKGS